MTQVVTVHTDFTDLNQMAQGLVGRVDPIKVILPGPDVVDAGEWVQFVITLQDGTPGFAGVGRCVTAVDNGEDRSAHQRFDVVIDALQFDSRGQQVFEHILSLSGYGAEGSAASEPVEDVDLDDVASDYTGSHASVGTTKDDQGRAVAVYDDDEDEDQDDGGAAVNGESLVPSMAPLAAMDDADEFGEPPTGNRAALAPAPAPPNQLNGGAQHSASFTYAGGLPFPKVPPRPLIDPSQRVSPAPRPKP